MSSEDIVMELKRKALDQALVGLGREPLPVAVSERLIAADARRRGIAKALVTILSLVIPALTGVALGMMFRVPPILAGSGFLLFYFVMKFDFDAVSPGVKEYLSQDLLVEAMAEARLVRGAVAKDLS